LPTEATHIAHALRKSPAFGAGPFPSRARVYGQSGRFAAAVVEPDVPEELPVPLPLIADPLLDGEEPLVPEPAAEPEPLPEVDPVPLVVPEPAEPELMVPDIEPVPLVVPEVEPPVFEAVFNRACPVVLSLQCVAADTLVLPLELDGEVVDWAAAPMTLAPTNATDRSIVLNM
jgi:hypothetical protein